MYKGIAGWAKKTKPLCLIAYIFKMSGLICVILGQFKIEDFAPALVPHSDELDQTRY